MSNSRALLDKNVARKILQALKKNAEGTALDASEQIALDTLRTEQLAGKRLFILPATDNILSLLFGTREEVRFLKDRVEVIISGRYYKRWARRLQDVGFTREDAHVLSFGTFGTDEQASFVGVDEVLTFDKPLVNLFEEKQKRIQEKLEAMKRHLAPPYDDARLPEVKWLGGHAPSPNA
jgi:hypothetical protein